MSCAIYWRSIQRVGKDPENGVLSYALTAAPAGMIIDAVTGLITWNSPVVGNAQVMVTDARGLASIQGYTLATKQNFDSLTCSFVAAFISTIKLNLY